MPSLPFREAVTLGKREIGVAGGKPGPGRGKKTDSNTTRLGRGNDYTLARLDRDQPELAQRVRPRRQIGRYSIVRADRLELSRQLPYRSRSRAGTPYEPPQGAASGPPTRQSRAPVFAGSPLAR